MFKLGINLDEISDSIETSIRVVSDAGINICELRTLNGKNFAFWEKGDILKVRSLLSNANIDPVAVATPLFKWYESNDSPDVKHDSFGFDPRLNDNDKEQIIKRVIGNARELSITRLRIFSRLGSSKHPVETFLNDSLFKYALDVADDNDIDLCLENEPVCQIHTKKDIAELFSKNTHPRLKLWLDVANMIEVGETVDEEFIEKIAKDICHIHAKDFVYENGVRRYVPIGKGIVNYDSILALFSRLIPKENEPVIIIETHAPDSKKIEYSLESLDNMIETLGEVNNGN